eukprot:scaffold5623_cov24-Prasinocladus_malaysianus.AAC.1
MARASKKTMQRHIAAIQHSEERNDRQAEPDGRMGHQYRVLRQSHATDTQKCKGCSLTVFPMGLELNECSRDTKIGEGKWNAYKLKWRIGPDGLVALHDSACTGKVKDNPAAKGHTIGMCSSCLELKQEISDAITALEKWLQGAVALDSADLKEDCSCQG